jgi:hypothetical protein
MTLTFTKIILQLRAISITLLLFGFNTAFAQLIPISLEQRIDSATTILEGKVISQTSYWDEAKTHIYTSNIVEVYKVFKGQLTAKQVEIITRGGIVGDRMERVSHMLELNIGDTGVFTAIRNTTRLTTKAQLTKLKAYAGAQGFIQYDLTKGTAKDVFSEYKNISKEVYLKIAVQTKSDVKTIQKAPFKIEQ